MDALEVGDERHPLHVDGLIVDNWHLDDNLTFMRQARLLAKEDVQ